MKHRAHGHSLLALLLLTAATASLTLSRFGPAGGELLREARQQQQFALAREALIARAVNDDNRPGSLPCPGPDGIAPLLAGQNCPQRLDGLPWSTLKIRPPLDLSHTPWRYLIAPGLQDSASSQPLNSDRPTGLVSALGGIPEDNIAAVLIAPGPALPGQRRPSTNPADYSELTLSQQGNGLHFSLLAGSNDRLYLIRRADILRAVERRVIRSVLRCLDAHARYSAGQIPWAAPVASAERHGQTGCTLGRVAATQPSLSLTHLAQESAAALQQAVTSDERLAACTRARNLLTGTAQALARSLQQVGNCLNSGNTPAAALQALRDELENSGLASLAQRQNLRQLHAGFTNGADSSALALQLETQCSLLHAQLSALQVRQTAAAGLLGNCAAQSSPLVSALQGLSPAGESSAAARWPIVWGAPACDFLLKDDGWWARNRWADGVFYHFSPPGTPSEHWPQIVGHGPVPRLVIAAGAARAGQRRPGLDLGDYLEGMHAEAATGATGAKIFSRHLADSNDQIAF